MDEKQHAEVLYKLQALEFQIGRLVSDAESEKDFRKQRNNEIDRRLRELELWKSEIHGRIIATVSIIGLVWGALIAIIVKVIS